MTSIHTAFLLSCGVVLFIVITAIILSDLLSMLRHWQIYNFCHILCMYLAVAWAVVARNRDSSLGILYDTSVISLPLCIFLYLVKWLLVQNHFVLNIRTTFFGPSNSDPNNSVSNSASQFAHGSSETAAWDMCALTFSRISGPIFGCWLYLPLRSVSGTVKECLLSPNTPVFPIPYVSENFCTYRNTKSIGISCGICMLIFGDQTLFDLFYHEFALYPNFNPSNQKDETLAIFYQMNKTFFIVISPNFKKTFDTAVRGWSYISLWYKFSLLVMNFSPLVDFNLLRHCFQEGSRIALPFSTSWRYDIFIGFG